MAMSTLQDLSVCVPPKRKKERLITCEKAKRDFDGVDHQNVIQRHTQILGVVIDR